MRYVIGLSIVLGLLTWRSDDVHRTTDLLLGALVRVFT
jgi:hypothetical protein